MIMMMMMEMRRTVDADAAAAAAARLVYDLAAWFTDLSFTLTEISRLGDSRADC